MAASLSTVDADAAGAGFSWLMFMAGCLACRTGKVLGTVAGGDIVLLHDGLEKPPNEPLPTFDRVCMVELILNGFEARGLQADTVGRLIATNGALRSMWFRP